MFPWFHPRLTVVAAVSALVVCLSGCTSLSNYVQNGFKVGPNYCRPAAPVAEHWIDAADIRTAEDPENLCRWWMVFNDPKLNYLVASAYRQNLTLREAGFRILQARAQLGIAVGNLFPQQQSASGRYDRLGMAGSRFRDSWDFGFNLSWELDFWGRFRRAVAAADDNLDASVADYDGVLVTLLADIAATYVEIRTFQQRIKLIRENVRLQREMYSIANVRFRSGQVSELDLDQAVSDLKQTEAGIPQLEIDMRQAENRLCTLLGLPPADLTDVLGVGPIPSSPPEVAIGIPADLLRRRPDVRRAERLAAAQAEQIGIAQADLYPAFYVNGTLGYQAQNFPDLFRNTAFNGSFGPSFQWNLLNYGRIVGNVRYQDAKFQELAVAYQNKVLEANEDVENGLVTFLRAQQRSKLLDESAKAAAKAVEIVVLQYKEGRVDFNRYAVIEQTLVQQQDLLAQSRGQIAQGLIATYRALGGGWEIRLGGDRAAPTGPNVQPGVPNVLEEVPAPPPAAAAAGS